MSNFKVCQKCREIVGGVKIQMRLYKDFVLLKATNIWRFQRKRTLADLAYIFKLFSTSAYIMRYSKIRLTKGALFGIFFIFNLK